MGLSKVFRKSYWSERLTTQSPSVPPTTQKSESSPSWTVYGSAKQLPFDKFIKIACEQDLTPLIIEGEPPTEVLQDAWLTIYTQYNDKIDSNFAIELEDKLHTENMRTKVFAVAALVKLLSLAYSEKNLETLRMLGFDYKGAPDDREELNKFLNKVTTRSKNWVVQINIKDKEKEDGTQQKTVTLEDVFAKMVKQLSIHMGYRVKPAEYTTYDFAVEFNDMQKSQMTNGRPD